MALPASLAGLDRLLTININESPGIDLSEYTPGMVVWPLFLDPDNATWVLYARYAPGTALPKHVHTGGVHFFTTKGTWGYREHPEDLQHAGSYLYEPPGGAHTFHIPEGGEAVEGFMVLNGVNVVLDEADNYVAIDNAGGMEAVLLDCAKRQGIETPRYIRPSGRTGFTT